MPSSYICRHCYCPQTKNAKVIFLHMSVSHSVHGGGDGGLHPGEGSTSRVGRVCIQGVGWADPHPPSDTTGYGQRAGGTHPTGMHSCFRKIYITTSFSTPNKYYFENGKCDLSKF